MIKIFAILLFCIALSSCGTASVKEIEAMTYPGYCKTEAGIDLTKDQCQSKMLSEHNSATPRKSTSEKMMENVNKDLDSRKTNN